MLTIKSPALIALALFAGALSVNAATIDTFDFTQGGWVNDVNGGTLSGTFTGTVEPSGLIEAADLTSFSAQFVLPGSSGAFQFTRIAPFGASGPFFSYNIDGGNSSLDFLAYAPSENILVCEGAAAPLACAGPQNSFGYSAAFGYTLQQATVTLVSSVTSNPPAPGTPTPEPATAAILGIGLLLIGIFRRGGRKAPRPDRNPIGLIPTNWRGIIWKRVVPDHF